MQVVVAGADLQGFEDRYVEVERTVTNYAQHQGAPVVCVEALYKACASQNAQCMMMRYAS
jgi:hypothetical protein